MPFIRLVIDFWRGLCQLPLFWQSWVHFSVLVNIGGSVLFWNQELALWVLAATGSSFLLGLGLLYIQGFTKLLGLMHLPMIVVIYHCYYLLQDIPITNPLGIWIRMLLLINGITLLIDLSDILRYAAGNRKSLLN